MLVCVYSPLIYSGYVAFFVAFAVFFPSNFSTCYWLGTSEYVTYPLSFSLYPLLVSAMNC